MATSTKKTMQIVRKAVTLADVARAVGTSKTTASHALSGKVGVSPVTRQAVLSAASEMGFEVDPLARLLSNGRNEKTVGFFTLDIDLSGRTRLLQIIQAALNDCGFSVPIYAYGYRGRDVVENQLELMGTLLAQRPRAILCNLSGVHQPVLDQLRLFVERGGIAVCYGYSTDAPDFCDAVIYEENTSFSMAAQHLMSLGHRDIGLFNVGQRKPEGGQLEQFARVLRENNCSLRNEWLFENTGTQRYEEDGEALAKTYLKLRNRPSAMVIANDYAAVAFMATLAAAGVRTPQDVSVVGHDNDAISKHGVVPLTTISYGFEIMAKHVVDLITSRLEGKYSGTTRRIDIQGELIVRGSTRQLS